MIKPNELRIGNYLLFKGEVIDVTTLSHDMKLDDDLYPIPLTTEWLERCGLENGKVLMNWKSGVKYNYFDSKVNVGNLTSTSGTFIEVKYVHQLQNIHFAFTGEELQIKMP